jgi:hypothetical protein
MRELSLILVDLPPPHRPTLEAPLPPVSCHASESILGATLGEHGMAHDVENSPSFVFDKGLTGFTTFLLSDVHLRL